MTQPNTPSETDKRKRVGNKPPPGLASGEPKARTVSRLPVWKKLGFGLAAAVLCLAVIEGALCVLGVRPVSYDVDPFVGFSSYLPLFVEKTEDDGTSMMVTAGNKLTLFNPQRFAIKKDPGVKRVFCVGGSTTFGRPYDDHTSFSGWLRAFLAEADLSRRWEIVNAGGISYASYRVAKVVEELAAYEPDLIVIYTGHNEFLERRTYAGLLDMPPALRALKVFLSRTRIYSAVHRLVRGSAKGRADASRDLLPSEVEEILNESVGPEAYARADFRKPEVLEHFRFNLERMIAVARSAGARVILVTPASKLRDCSPFRSEHREDLDPASRRRCRSLYDAALLAMGQDRYADALAACDEALVLDDRYAHLHFVRGQLLLALGRYAEAEASLTRAREEDVCPLRALETTISIVRETAGRLKVPLVDFVAMAEARSDHGIPGENLFLDHVHPTTEGHRLLALAILDRMAEEGIVRLAETWDETAAGRVTGRVLQSVDRTSHAAALRNLAKVLSWAGKSKEAAKLASEAARLLPNDVEALLITGFDLTREGRHEEALERYRKALGIEDSVKVRTCCGNALARLGRYPEAMAHFREALRIQPDHAESYNNLGNALSALGRPLDAIPQYEAAVRFKPDHADAYYNWGNAELKAGRFEEALVRFREAVRIKPDHANAHNNTGITLVRAGRFEEAVESFREALRLKPDWEQVQNNLRDVRALLNRQSQPERP